MRNVLVLGGTRFFGKRLVEKLIHDGDSAVTILTRGVTADDFGDHVTRLAVDRTDEEALARAAGGGVWDVVYDNICYSPDEAAAAVRIFAGRTKKYILTSSLSVYDPQPEALTEADFDPEHYTLQLGGKTSRWLRSGFRLCWARMTIRADCIFILSMSGTVRRSASRIRRRRSRSSVRTKPQISCTGWAAPR